MSTPESLLSRQQQKLRGAKGLQLMEIASFLLRRKGWLFKDKYLKCWIAQRPIDGVPFPVAVRTYREFRRLHHFGRIPQDNVFHWLRGIDDCEMLYDIGSANGLEALLVSTLHKDAKVTIVEPHLPSVESILLSIAHRRLNGEPIERFEIFNAAADAERKHDRLLMHSLPLPGETGNSFADVTAYDRGGRADRAVAMRYWLPSVTLDSLHETFGLPLATHVKMDIDGFENRAMEGAQNLLESRAVRSWALELNGEQNRDSIREMMLQHGYEELSVWNHYPTYEHYTADHIFVRDDLVGRYGFLRDL